MKRPILIIALGFIIGILGGLYFNIVPFVFIFSIYVIVLFKKVKSSSNNDAIRILKVFIHNNIILIFTISAFIGSVYIISCNKKYETIYNEFSNNEIIGIVVSNKKESEYKNTYKIKLSGYREINFLLRISKNKKIDLNYGDKIKVKGKYSVPEGSRNYGGFDYRRYLKTQDVYGIFEADNVDILSSDNVCKIELISNNFKQKIIENTNKILPESTIDLFLGILIGYDDNLSEEIQENFRKSSLTHLLAVSGSHIAYIIVAFVFLGSRFKFHKKISNILTIVFLIFFMYITEFSSSVVRASIMGIVLLMSIILHRKNDMINTISISLLLILLENPYKILDTGLILSYFATFGIICFSKMTVGDKKEESNIYAKIKDYIKDLVLITVFANIFVIPIMIYNFNTLSLTFIISNLIAGILIGPITIGGFILGIISLINIKFAYIIGIPYNILLELLIQSTNFTSLLPFSEIFVLTPNIIIIVIYYLFLFLYISYRFLKKEYFNRYLVKKSIIFIYEFCEKLKRNYKKIVIFTITLVIIISLTLKIISKDLRIYFIDVGQGDSTLVITPTNKKILIDGGGVENGKFDVGKSTLLPYLLDRKIRCLDYICISHFDSDHCKGLVYILNNIKVKNIILSKQYERTNNFKEIMGIAKKKNISILKVEAGNILQIDKDVRLKIFSPSKILTSDINDNSIVMKLEYLNFSCLFTGDISKGIEKNLVKKYGNYLKSDILKVAHHGSSTSSDEDFIKVVSPKISLIGVGKNNKFGHPNEEVIQILENINSEIYRTDENGEIILRIDRIGRIKTKKHIKQFV